jgi:hypothetical protein
MLELSQVQWEILQTHDANQFVDAVIREFMADRQDILEGLNLVRVKNSMHSAYNYAVRVGFKSTPHMVRMMYLAADAPGICDDPLVEAYIRKAPATPEQRLDDLLTLVSRRLESC